MKRNEIVSVGHIEIKQKDFNAAVDEESIAVLPTRNLVLFPGIVYPINLVRESSRRLAQLAEERHLAVLVACQKDESIDNPDADDLYDHGVVAQVLKLIKLPDDSALAMVMTAPTRARITGSAGHDSDGTLRVSIEQLKEPAVRLTDELKAKLQLAGSTFKELVEQSATPPPVDMSAPNPAENIALTINTMCATAPVPVSERVAMLAARGPRQRLDRLVSALLKQKQSAEIRAKIEEGARMKMSERQRNAILEAQLDTIREELYGEGRETTALQERLNALTLSDETRAAIAREIGRLEHLNPQSPDFQTQYAYLETVLELPWDKTTPPVFDFKHAENELNSTHSGLEKVKERVLEQIAMMLHSPEAHSPIICLVGPPGVGKTSLGQSIAKALGREFRRVSLGGMHDESEIRGHRRTYIGAMPGRIIDAVRRAGTRNPVIMLDEIDKLGQDYKGNPSAALLEVLDPEQNVRFHDNYIDLDFDLSNVLFITTANSLAPIEAPLLDRMEVISLSGYSAEEKLDIARDHLLPALRKEMGLDTSEVPVSDEAVSYIIDNYTAESGVRQLQKNLASVMRKYIRAKVSGQPFEVPVKPDALRALLGVETNSHDKYSTDSTPGVVTGLAWTAAGGEIIFIEAVLTAGKGEGRLTLTGNLGDVMKESAAIAHRYVMAHADALGIDAEKARADLHIHVPDGAIPKDGPSAGITMTTAIVSAMTGRPVRERVAMTGEITLRGKVLPVGGIKEKILAARRAGIREIIISAENRRNVEEIKPEYVEGLTFLYVTTIDEVIARAF